jgi:phosphoenolpyruvate---glycerone phosphotransferase subunit DhaK
MKKLINNPNNVVTEMLEGIAITNPDIVCHLEFNVISRKNKINKVGIVSGGGSGHEPAHAGYVGKGMLDAAVAGNVFASPSADKIIKGIKEADTGKGVLLVIKNYSGDVMNFEMAKELAEMEGINVKSVVVRDDVAVPDSTYSTGRRGIAGTVFVHKIAGAKAEDGGTLEEVFNIAQKTIANVRSMGIAISSCILPGVGKPGFILQENEIGIGIGIHGEPGIEKTNIKTARETVSILGNKILEDMDYTNSEVSVIINGMGATPIMELYIIAKELDLFLKEKNIIPYRYFVGNYMTSLEMAGCSISLLKLDDELKRMIDAPCNTTGLKVGI